MKLESLQVHRVDCLPRRGDIVNNTVCAFFTGILRNAIEACLSLYALMSIDVLNFRLKIFKFLTSAVFSICNFFSEDLKPG